MKVSEKTLTDEYHGKVLALRHAFISNSPIYFLPAPCVESPPPLSAAISLRVTIYTAKLASQCPPS